MDERVKKAFDFAADLAKQLITLATGLIALTITFSKDFIQHAPAASQDMGTLGMVLVLGIRCLWHLDANGTDGKSGQRTS
jgi:hypothetical protein